MLLLQFCLDIYSVLNEKPLIFPHYLIGSDTPLSPTNSL